MKALLSHIKNPYKLLSDLRLRLHSPLVKNICAGLGSQGVVVLFGLCSSILIARTLGPVGRGYIGLSNTLTNLGVQLSILGFHSSNTFYLSKKHALLPRMLSNSIALSVALGGSMSIVLFFLNHAILKGDPLPSSLILVSLIIIPIQICFQLFQGLFTGLQNFKSFNLNEMMNKGLVVFLIVTFYFTGQLSALSITLFQGIALTTCVAWMFFSLKALTTKIEPPSLPLIKEHTLYGGKVYLASLFGWGISRLDMFFLQRYQSVEELGYFSVALSIIDILLLFPVVVATVIRPKLCREENITNKWRLIKTTSVWSMLIIIAVAATLTLWKTPILWVFGNAFAPCHNMLLALFPSFILSAFVIISSQFVSSIHMPWSLVISWMIACLLKCVLSSTLIPEWGIYGAGLSSASAYLTVCTYILCAIRKTVKYASIN